MLELSMLSKSRSKEFPIFNMFNEYALHNNNNQKLKILTEFKFNDYSPSKIIEFLNSYIYPYLICLNDVYWFIKFVEMHKPFNKLVYDNLDINKIEQFITINGNIYECHSMNSEIHKTLVNVLKRPLIEIFSANSIIKNYDLLNSEYEFSAIFSGFNYKSNKQNPELTQVYKHVLSKYKQNLKWFKSISIKYSIDFINTFIRNVLDTLLVAYDNLTSDDIKFGNEIISITFNYLGIENIDIPGIEVLTINENNLEIKIIKIWMLKTVDMHKHV